MPQSIDDRLSVIDLRPREESHTLAEVTLEGLSRCQKSLPCRFFYDSTGSRLFEQICRLPEYYLTRTEQSILERSAHEIIAASTPPVPPELGVRRLSMVELGSGSSCKTRILIEAAIARQGSFHYSPIDISADFLIQSARSLLSEYPQLEITAIAAEYTDAIPVLPDGNLPRLFLFLGSNIGNFDPDEAVQFLSAIRARLRPSDHILIGADMVKDTSVLEAAYNDSAGITEAFNKNLLNRINDELGGRFDLDAFAHAAPFIAEMNRIEMRLISRADQDVHIAALDRTFHFTKGEYIHTENSHKYTPDSLKAICQAAGLKIDQTWTDNQNWLTVNLLSVHTDDDVWTNRSEAPGQ